MIGIVDYRAGNLNSVMKAFDFLGMKFRIVSSKDEIRGLDKIVVPGVGSFGAAIENLKREGLFDPLLEWLNLNRPFLGICLGFQLLFEGSEESPDVEGFSVIKGRCTRLIHKKVPHIGWNLVRFTREDPVVEGLNREEYLYFVHSYAVKEVNSDAIGITDYGGEFVSIVRSGNIYGMQFHPEKSGETGLKLLSNWGRLC